MLQSTENDLHAQQRINVKQHEECDDRKPIAVFRARASGHEEYSPDQGCNLKPPDD